jgi:hypothetical protein
MSPLFFIQLTSLYDYEIIKVKRMTPAIEITVNGLFVLTQKDNGYILKH